MSGPLEAIKKNCEKYVALKQGNEKVSSIAKRIRHKLGTNSGLDEIIRALQEVGLQRINIGLESASNKVLKAIRKGITKDDLLGAVRLSKETGVKFAYCGIYNLPSEDFSTIKETAKFIADNNIDFMPGVARPYPGTELARLGENINWQNMESKAGRLGTKISPAIAVLLYKFFIHYYRDGLFFMFKRKNFGKNLIFIKRLLKRCILQWDLS